MRFDTRRVRIVAATGVLGALLATGISPASAQTAQAFALRTGERPAYTLALPDGGTAQVFTNGTAHVVSRGGRAVAYRVLHEDSTAYQPAASRALKAQVAFELASAPPQAYAPERVVVAYRSGTIGRGDTIALTKADRAAKRRPAFTNDASVDRAFAAIGVDRADRLFRQFPRSILARASTPALDLANVYRLHVSGASVRQAVARLSKLPSIAYVSPDWTVQTMHARTIPLQRSAVLAAQHRRIRPDERRSLQAYVPSNYAVSASAQSMLNAPGVDAVGAFDEIQRHFHQLPGTGEIVTNVSLGDLDDVSAVQNAGDRCHSFAESFGYTSEMIGGQRYLDLPAMPLIAAYTASDDGTLSGTGETCGQDPELGEVGLDFSVMAPLPHEDQRGSALGAGFTDLLGIAPGATYRLVVPAASSPTFTDIQGALLGAAMQQPRPNVITASLGYGFDIYGFPARFLEEDPLTEAIVHAIVQNENIVVCVASNDGVRLENTDAAVGTSGGSAPTNAIESGMPTDLNDVEFTTAPSLVFDSGSIDVGGTTLDDVSLIGATTQPSNPLAAELTFPETRWNGMFAFSSGFGTRVNLAAPSDNIVATVHDPVAGATAQSTESVLSGGTSAAAPEVAAAAAVMLQVARLTARPFRKASDVRSFLESTGSTIAASPQADVALTMGSQVDVRRGVETLLAKGGIHDAPSVTRVAIAQRRGFGGITLPDLNTVFVSDTDPANIDLRGQSQTPNDGSDQDEDAWITIAPDWENLPQRSTYALRIDGKSATLAKTPWTRVLPAQLFAAAGLSFPPTSTQTIDLKYVARGGGKTLSVPIALTFGAADATTAFLPAPVVKPVTTGSTIHVTYDLTNSRTASPALVVSYVGHPLLMQWAPTMQPVAYVAPLTSPKGSVDVPVSALQGDGVYGLAIEGLGIAATLQKAALPGLCSGYSVTRVVSASDTSMRPAAPLLSSEGSVPAHDLEIAYGKSFTVRYDVRNVKGATGAALEISAPGPTITGNYNTFDNPQGTIRDANGKDSGSIYYMPLSGTHGSVTLSGAQANLVPSMEHNVRVIPMRFGVAAGEAGDVSTVSMDALVPSDGGSLTLGPLLGSYVVGSGGFGVNANGLDGFLSSLHGNADGSLSSTLETFDQLTGMPTATAGSASGAFYDTIGNWGIFGDDLGLYALESFNPHSIAYGTLKPVAGGSAGPAWTPALPPGFTFDSAAADSSDDAGTFVGENPALPSDHDYEVFTSQIDQNTFGSLIDINAPLASYGSPILDGFAVNPATNVAYAAFSTTLSFSSPLVMVTVDLKTGAVGTMPIQGSGFVQGMAIDPTTNKMAVLTDSTTPLLTIYDLTANTSTKVTSFKSDALWVAADPKNGKFVFLQPDPDDFSTNVNATSALLVYDESGNRLETIERYGLGVPSMILLANGLQLNPGRKTAFTYGAGGTQLLSIPY